MRRSVLGRMLCFKDNNIYLFWNEELKLYEELTKDGAITVITSILENLKDDDLLEVEWVTQILKNLTNSRLYRPQNNFQR